MPSFISLNPRTRQHSFIHTHTHIYPKEFQKFQNIVIKNSIKFIYEENKKIKL